MKGEIRMSWKIKRDRWDPTIGIIQGTGANRGRISEARASGHGDFIKTNWERLAFHAWRGYQAQGRGALILNESEIHTRSGRCEPVAIRLLYLGEQSGDFRTKLKGKTTSHGWSDDYTARAVAEYEPRREVLVILQLREGGTVFYRVRQGFVDPPDAKPDAN
jgi:hypothetical protein